MSVVKVRFKQSDSGLIEFCLTRLKNKPGHEIS